MLCKFIASDFFVTKKQRKKDPPFPYLTNRKVFIVSSEKNAKAALHMFATRFFKPFFWFRKKYLLG